MTVSEIKKQFKELIMDRDPYFGNIPNKFSTDEFIQDMLGMSAAPPQSKFTNSSVAADD